MKSNGTEDKAAIVFDYRETSSFSLILHGWEENIGYEVLLPKFVEFFSLAGISPSIGDLTLRDSFDVKAFSFQTMLKRIQQNDYRHLAGLSLYSLADKNDKQSHKFAIGIRDTYGDQNCFFVDAVHSKAKALEIALGFLRSILKDVTPIYGYSLEMALGNDPVLFASGVFAANRHMDDEIRAWQYASHAQLEGTKHREGFFRHVFEVNILSPRHVANQIGTKSFLDWVAEPGHGKIEQWKEKVWVWFVPQKDRIRVANILQFNGLLTAPSGFENELIG